MVSLQQMEVEGHEQVVVYRDAKSGLKAIIAVHNTRRGPGLGGARMWPYASLDEALEDALRLARAMTYKAAVSNLPLGGGKAVIMGDPDRHKDSKLLLAFGRMIHGLGGRYITAEDVGMQVKDMAVIRRVTPYVTGTARAGGGSGDPSEVTALGVLEGMRATVEELDGLGGKRPSLKGWRVAIQGLGKVGYRLAHLLTAEGAVLTGSDLDAKQVNKAVRELGVTPVSEDEIYEVPCDLFAPCALGAVLNRDTIPRLRCRAVAGAANNQLAEAKDADRLLERDIVYAPDYVINAGGLINIAVALEPKGYNRTRAERRVRSIYTTLQTIYRLARERRTSPALAADHLAEARLQRGRPWNGKPLRIRRG